MPHYRRAGRRRAQHGGVPEGGKDHHPQQRASETKHVNKGKLYYHPNRLNPNNSSQWPSGVQINFRGRTNSNDYATYLSTVTGAGDYNCTYFSNSGYIGNKYKIASNLPSNGKCQKAYLSVYWVA